MPWLAAAAGIEGGDALVPYLAVRPWRVGAVVTLHACGWTDADIAAALGITAGRVWQIRRKSSRELEALRVRIREAIAEAGAGVMPSTMFARRRGEHGIRVVRETLFVDLSDHDRMSLGLPPRRG